MDHMRISATQPSSAILSQPISSEKVKKLCLKVPKQGQAKRNGVINPQNYNFKVVDDDIHTSVYDKWMPLHSDYQDGGDYMTGLVKTSA